MTYSHKALSWLWFYSGFESARRTLAENVSSEKVPTVSELKSIFDAVWEENGYVEGEEANDNTVERGSVDSAQSHGLLETD